MLRFFLKAFLILGGFGLSALAVIRLFQGMIRFDVVLYLLIGVAMLGVGLMLKD